MTKRWKIMRNKKNFIASVEVVRDALADTMVRLASTEPMDVKALKDMAVVLKEVDKVVRDNDDGSETPENGLDFLERIGREGLISNSDNDEKKKD